MEALETIMKNTVVIQEMQLRILNQELKNSSVKSSEETNWKKSNNNLNSEDRSWQMTRTSEETPILFVCFCLLFCKQEKELGKISQESRSQKNQSCGKENVNPANVHIFIKS